MFVSLNKKFMCVFFLFFLLMIGLFIGFFSLYYEKNMKEEAQNFMDTRTRLVDIAYNNNYLSAKLKTFVQEGKIKPDAYLAKMINEESYGRNKNIVDSLNNIYGKKYDRLDYLQRFLYGGLIWVSLGVALLWVMMRQMVLRAIDKLTIVSEKISQGNFKERVFLDRQFLRDEFSILGETFNQMLQNIEDNIMKISNNQHFLQSIIDAIPDGIRVIDESGKIIMANRAYQKIIGENRCIGEYCFKQSMNLKHFCNSGKVVCPLKEFKKEGIEKLSTVQYFTKNSEHPVSVSAAKMNINENGVKKEYVIEAIRDLNDEIQFSHQQKISSLAFLATSVAHEMKNNLGSLRIIMEQILDNKNIKNEKDEGFFRLAYGQVLECIKIPENLLNLAKNKSEKNTDVNIKEVAGSVGALLDYEAKRKGIEFKVDIKDDVFVLGNESDFKMIFLNLCQNAIKAMSSGGVLKISANTKGEKIEIEVNDTGRGIEKSKQERIFEPFYSTGERGETGGTGLGLSIVKSLVESFKGKIRVKSKIGLGTTFIMTFPCKTNK